MFLKSKKTTSSQDEEQGERGWEERHAKSPHAVQEAAKKGGKGMDDDGRQVCA